MDRAQTRGRCGGDAGPSRHTSFDPGPGGRGLAGRHESHRSRRELDLDSQPQPRSNCALYDAHRRDLPARHLLPKRDCEAFLGQRRHRADRLPSQPTLQRNEHADRVQEGDPARRARRSPRPGGAVAQRDRHQRVLRDRRVCDIPHRPSASSAVGFPARQPAACSNRTSGRTPTTNVGACSATDATSFTERDALPTTSGVVTAHGAWTAGS